MRLRDSVGKVRHLACDDFQLVIGGQDIDNIIFADGAGTNVDFVGGESDEELVFSVRIHGHELRDGQRTVICHSFRKLTATSPLSCSSSMS